MGFLDDMWSGIKSVANDVWDQAARPALDAAGLGVIADGIEDGVDAAVDGIDDVVEAVDEVAQQVADGLQQLGEDFVDAMEDLGDELDEAFSKEGWMTKFMEDYVPGGGFVTAIAHAAAGNEDYAKMAAVKGAVSAIEAAAAVAGTIALGPVGGALGAGIGNGLGQMLEIAVRDELPESVRHLIPQKDVLGALTEMGGAVAGGAIGAAGGKVFGAAKGAATSLLKKGAKEAAEEAAEQTTAQLVKVAIMKKYLMSPTSPAIDAAREEAGFPAEPRRGVSPEQLEQLNLMEQKLTMATLANQRHVRELEGATPADLVEFDRQIFTAKTRSDQLENNGADAGQFYSYEHPTLGTYYMRDGVVVWELEDLAEATKSIELDKVGMTEEQVEKFISDQWEQRFQDYGAEHPDWEVVHDPILGDYMVKEGKVVFGTTNPEEAQRKYGEQEAQERGFASVDEYKDELINSWRISHEYAVEAGNATGEWVTGGQSDIVGDYMIKDGQIVWGASTPEQAEAMLPNQLAQEKGFTDVEAMRQELERSWRLSQEYDEEAGTATGEWQTGGQSAIVGPYMIKDGVVVWGAESEEQAEQLLPEQLARNQGFESVEDLREELVNSWRIAHEYDEEAGTATGEWQTGGQTDIVGPYMIKDGEVVFGATTPEEAEAILAGEMLPPGDESLVDFDGIEPEFPDEIPVDENGDPIPPELIDIEGMPDDDGSQPDGGDTEAETIAELRAQLAVLQQQVESLSQELEQRLDSIDDGEPELPDEVPVDENGMPLEDGIDDEDESEDEDDDDDESDDDGSDDDIDFDKLEPTLPEELPVDQNGRLIDDPSAASDSEPPTDGDEDQVEYKPAVMPEDPLDWDTGQPDPATGEPATEYKPAVMPEDPLDWDTGQPDPATGEPATEYRPAVMPDESADGNDPYALPEELPVDKHGHLLETDPKAAPETPAWETEQEPSPLIEFPNSDEEQNH